MKTAIHRLLIADDHAMFREGLRAVLERQSDLRVVGEAGDGLEAIERVRLLQPDVTLMDHQMPRLDGVQATARIREFLPDARIIILDVHGGVVSSLPEMRALNPRVYQIFVDFEHLADGCKSVGHDLERVADRPRKRGRQIADRLDNGKQRLNDRKRLFELGG